ncbi:PREDICTED: uncharacterized protein LOC108496840 [Lepidothrix coronata]|uniref:Uncharacterized protein LOC108496840 n=1 Tax=Lepidothrix coronata TaxID=321398 RepID=A0A6J0H5U6_9PASS|nr:PREDICTED: uncharacterized protein LOC108496840 [Lepidothrix coronata]
MRPQRSLPAPRGRLPGYGADVTSDATAERREPGPRRAGRGRGLIMEGGARLDGTALICCEGRALSVGACPGCGQGRGECGCVGAGPTGAGPGRSLRALPAGLGFLDGPGAFRCPRSRRSPRKPSRWPRGVPRAALPAQSRPVSSPPRTCSGRGRGRCGGSGADTAQGKAPVRLRHGTSARNGRNRSEIHPPQDKLGSAAPPEGGGCGVCRRCTNRLLQLPNHCCLEAAEQSCERARPQRPANQSGTKPEQMKILLQGQRDHLIWEHHGKEMNPSGRAAEVRSQTEGGC